MGNLRPASPTTGTIVRAGWRPLAAPIVERRAAEIGNSRPISPTTGTIMRAGQVDPRPKGGIRGQAAVQAWVDAGVWSVSPAWTTGATSSAVSANPTSASSIAAPKTTPSTLPSGLSSGPPELPGRT